MSNRREQLAESLEGKSVEEILFDYFHLPLLAMVVGFIFWNRIRNWDNFVVDGTVYYSGNDPWYHLRATQYSVENFPARLAFDPFTYFPFGSSPGQFGTLMDQVIALLALVVGLGSPSDSLVRHVFLVWPPIVAVLITVPAYLIGRRLGGRVGGMIVVGFIALAPDRLLQVTLAGHVQHHGTEVLLMSLSILGLMVALRAAQNEKPVYELVANREFGAIRGTIGWSLLAGVAMGIYLWVWPPGMWIFLILSLFFVVQMSLDHVRGQSPEHVAFVGVISMVTAGLLQIGTLRTIAIESGATDRSPLLVLLGVVSAGGVVFLAWLSRELDMRDQPRYAYPGAIVGVAIVGSVLLSVATPGIWEFFLGQFDRVFGFLFRQVNKIVDVAPETSPGGGTIGEVRPMEFDEIRDIYKLATFTAGIGAGVILLKQFLDEEPNAEELLVLVWAALIVVASLTQIRFSYYIAIPLGALNAVFVGYVFELAGTPDRDLNVETYQVLTIGLILLVMFVPLFPGAPLVGDSTTAISYADNRSATGNVLAWDDSLTWMDENTPPPGQYAHPENDPMGMNDRYRASDDYEYPDGAYGVMSWWDYGHWITAQGNRIPNANPFQQGPTDAAEFLLAQSEEAGLSKLQELDESEQAQTKYVVIDWQMVETETRRPIRGKFFAPAVFHPDFEPSDFSKRMLVRRDRGVQVVSRVHQQPYYESMMVRLYHYHGSAKEPEPVVVDFSQEAQFQAGPAAGDPYVVREENRPIRLMRNITQARNYVEEDGDSQVGGLGAMPTERVEGLEHFRLVHMSETMATGQSERGRTLQRKHGVNNLLGLVAQRNIWRTGFGEAYVQQLNQVSGNQSQEEIRQRASRQAFSRLYPNSPSFTKVFERVPGATIQGTGPENTEINVRLRLDPENGRQFTYSRKVVTDDEGNFEVTVPYATQGYNEYGTEEGYTNTSVRATGPYTFSTEPSEIENGTLSRWGGAVNVSEAQVIGEEEEPLTVELQEQTFNTSTGGRSDGEQTGTDGEDSESGEDGDDTDGGQDNSTAGVADASETVSPIARVGAAKPASRPAIP